MFGLQGLHKHYSRTVRSSPVPRSILLLLFLNHGSVFSGRPKISHCGTPPPRTHFHCWKEGRALAFGGCPSTYGHNNRVSFLLLTQKRAPQNRGGSRAIQPARQWHQPELSAGERGLVQHVYFANERVLTEGESILGPRGLGASGRKSTDWGPCRVRGVI